MRAHLSCKFLRAAQEVCMNVRLCDRHNAQPLARSGGDVLVHITLGIKHNGFTRALASNQVGVLSKLGVVDLSKEHVGNLRCSECWRRGYSLGGRCKLKGAHQTSRHSSLMQTTTGRFPKRTARCTNASGRRRDGEI